MCSSKLALDTKAVTLCVSIGVDTRLQQLVVAVGDACERTTVHQWLALQSPAGCKVERHAVGVQQMPPIQALKSRRHSVDDNRTWRRKAGRERNLLALVVEVVDVLVEH